VADKRNTVKGVVAMVEVHNLNKTADRKPPPGYPTWRIWWETSKRKKFSKCSTFGCTQFADVGAHVQKEGLIDRSWYIVPLCARCNNRSSELPFYVDSNDMMPIHK